MTALQQLAFERIQKINKQVREVLPKRWEEGEKEFCFSKDDVMAMKDLLYEQDDWLEALLDEEQRDGGGD